MIFDSKWLLLLAPLVAIGGGALAWWGRRRRVTATTAWSAGLGAHAATRGKATPWVIGVAVLLAAVAVAGPRGGRTTVKTEARALSLVIATDISRSMLAEDVAPSRLGRAKREARRLVQDLDGDRLGLLAFAGRSYILTPLTVDGGAVALYLDGLDPDLASDWSCSRPQPKSPTAYWSSSPMGRSTTRCPRCGRRRLRSRTPVSA
jgi:Ca-activated chloride channel family protein